MSEIKYKQSLLNLDKALNRLHEALMQPENDLAIDATIQRFEFVIELFWKTLKRLLANEGIETNTPKDVLKKAFAAKLIYNELIWLQMLNDRNETSHIYDEEKAIEIYHHIKNNYNELSETFSRLKKQFGK
jgi:nucleotidyltransferase substrate binding protein (TIGR01987 family)